MRPVTARGAGARVARVCVRVFARAAFNGVAASAGLQGLDLAEDQVGSPAPGEQCNWEEASSVTNDSLSWSVFASLGKVAYSRANEQHPATWTCLQKK